LRAPQTLGKALPLREVTVTINTCYPELGFSSAVDALGHRFALTEYSVVSGTPVVGKSLVAEVRTACIVIARVV
jgi:hypothetical protein